MPLNLKRKDYVFPSSEPLVQACLANKLRLVKKPGIAHASCCACVEYTARGPARRHAFGNSRIYPRVHGEGCAVEDALEKCRIELEGNGGSIRDLIHRVYIELSPCERCRSMLEAINPDMEVQFSWDYPGEVEAWKAAALALCSR